MTKTQTFTETDRLVQRLIRRGHAVVAPGALRCWLTIARLADERGHPPSLRDVAGELGVWHTGVLQHVRTLRRKGFLAPAPEGRVAARTLVSRYRLELFPEARG